MSDASLYLITDIDGFTPDISRLVSMMNYARHTTLTTVKGLTVEQLDYLVDESSNSIGAMLLHLAAVDFYYSIYTLENRLPTDEELKPWKPALELGELGRKEIRGHSLEYYTEVLASIRTRTLDSFKQREDSWLYEEQPFWGSRPANNYFKWFHVFEDEINHRGQMRWIRKRAGG